MLYEFECKQCHKNASKDYIKPSWITKGKIPLYCSKQCSSLASRKRIKFECSNCNCDIERSPSDLKINKTGFYFCGKKCQDNFASIENEYKTGGAKVYNRYTDYRKKAIQAFGNKCELCSWAHTVDVHHIDGNRDNNDLNNLCVLCPNCHSLTETNRYNVNVVIFNEIEKKIKKLRLGF